MADKKDSILIFTFSPVQGFIESSRRTRDFFTGSYILSWLTFRVMYRLIEGRDVSKEDFVYPILDKQPLWDLFEHHQISDLELLAVANFPNRFVLRVEYGRGEGLVEKIKEIFQEEWKEIYEFVLEKFLKKLRKKNITRDEIYEDEVWEQFEKQVDNYFVPFVVVLRDTGREDYSRMFKDSGELEKILNQQEDKTYGYTYDLAERILGSRKTFRPYKGIVDYPEGADMEKFDGCSVCGERKALAIDWLELREEYDFQGDRLCGVCLVKRLGYKYFEDVFKRYMDENEWNLLFSSPHLFQNFPSTREIAGIKFKEKLLNHQKAARKYENYLSRMPEEIKDSKNTSSVAYLRKRMREKPLSIIVNYDSQIFHQEEHKNLFREFEELSGQIPSLPSDRDDSTFPIHTNSYFAIFYADGDNMGKWLGLKQEIRKEPLTEEFHRKFSGAISDYALEDVPEVVERDHPGKLVYAGGDDVFAFVHPWDVVPILDELRRRFESRLESFPVVEGKKPSMSAGVVIGHAKAPLKRLIRNVRDAERKAKRDFGRDAFVLRVVVRSGSTWDFGGKWEYCYNGRKFDTAEEFTRTVNLLMDEGECFEDVKCNLSSNFVYDIRDMLMTFEPEDFDENALRIFETLFRRSFRRKFHCSGNSDKNKRAVESAITNYLQFMRAMVDVHLEEAKGDNSGVNENAVRYEIVKNFANMFYVARFMAKEVRI